MRATFKARKLRLTRHYRHLRERPTERLKLIAPPGFTGAQPGGPSRWATARTAEWEPLAPRIMVEVGYDHCTDGRFRHGTRLMRFRPDKAPAQCTMDQVEPRANALVKLLD